MMERWRELADMEGDDDAYDEAGRELVWILEAWGRTEEAELIDIRHRTEFVQQMLFE